MAKKADMAARDRVVASKGGKKTVAPIESTAKPRRIVKSSESGKLVSPDKAKSDPKGTIAQEVMSPLERFLKDWKPIKVPKNPAAMADLVYLAREERLKLSKIVDQIEETEKTIKQYFIDNLSKKDSTGVAGKRARVQITEEKVPQVEDWDATYKHIKKTGQFDLLNRALNRSAVKARWDAGKEVPGVRSFQVKKVSVTKL